MRTAFLGTGRYVPDRVVKNTDLEALMETSDAWIVQRTGIEQRHHVDFALDPMGASEMGARAAQRALTAAHIRTDEVDFIIYATLSPDQQFPGDGVIVQAKLNIPAGVPALDIRNQCSGFLYGLSVADAFIRCGAYKRILLIGAECHSSGLDFTTRGRDVAVLFGDGAAAVVLGPTDDPQRGVLSVQIHSDGRHANELRLAVPSSAQMPRLSQAHLEGAHHYPFMNGKSVFKHAVTRMPEVIVNVLTASQVSAEDLQLFIAHQANARINAMVAQKMGFRADQVFNNIHKYGNTTAASIPLALDEAVAARRIESGGLVCLASFGAGFTWGAAVLRW